ncbi:MAG: DHH family phosphoesterase [Candidatus Bathyarchaeota archaeon]|nr:DHH family phosphoesterase [Candidatus Bathyarchaeum tardum]WGM88990.1 MAG: DHH family phosphoesterase [Candidatus Bathyarchaeum tardum]
MQIRKITSLIDKLDAKLVVLLCHHNADPDAIGAAFAFDNLLKQLRPNLKTEIGAAAGPSKLSKAVIKAVNVELTDQPQIENADLVVLLDTNTTQQLDDWAALLQPAQPILLIDHHAPHPETEHISALSVTDETASSTCEIVYRLFKEAKIKPSVASAKALFLGIAFDSRHFILAGSETLKIVAELAQIVNPRETLPILSLPMDYSERVARLKTAGRMKIVKVNNWLIALSRLSTFQASAARGLVAFGAHVAIVAGEKDGGIQVSFRASHEFFTETGIHMGRDLATPLGEFLGGMGGGHSVSAGANGNGDVNGCLNFCEKLIKQKLS